MSSNREDYDERLEETHGRTLATAVLLLYIDSCKHLPLPRTVRSTYLRNHGHGVPAGVQSVAEGIEGLVEDLLLIVLSPEREGEGEMIDR